MNEYKIGFTAVGALIGLDIAALFYMAGGRNNKSLRRFVASAILTATVIVTALVLGKFSWLLLALYPIKIGEFILGYGESGGTPKWLKRLRIAGVSLLSGIMLCSIFGGGWLLLPLHLWLGLCTTQFSISNPIQAAAEEPLVCVLNNLIVVFYVFI